MVASRSFNNIDGKASGVRESGKPTRWSRASRLSLGVVASLAALRARPRLDARQNHHRKGQRSCSTWRRRIRSADPRHVPQGPNAGWKFNILQPRKPCSAGFAVNDEEITVALKRFNAAPLVPASHMRVYRAARFVGFRGVVPMLGQHGLCAHHALAGLDAVASDLVDLKFHSFLHKPGPFRMQHALVQRRRGRLQTDRLGKLAVFAKEPLGSASGHWLSGYQG